VLALQHARRIRITSNGEVFNAKWGSVLLLLELSHPRWQAGAAQ
jgi:hypothetical protein